MITIICLFIVSSRSDILSNINKDESLILYFNFDEPILDEKFIKDLSNKNNTGYVNGPIWREDSRFGNGSYFFDGVDDSISVNDSPNLSPNATNEISIIFWMKPYKTDFAGEGSQGDYIHILGKGGYGNDYEYVFRQYNASNSEAKNNRISFYMFNISGGLGVGSSYSDKINMSEWTFIAGIFNGTHVQIWKNGILRDTHALTEYGIKSEDGPSPLNIGTADNDSYFTGYIDELRIYSRVLNEKELMSLYLKNK